MKRFALFAILLAFSATLFAQDGSRFSTDGASVTWQQVFQTPLDSAGVAGGLIASGHFDNVVVTKDGFTCRIVPHMADYMGAGVKRGLVSMYLVSADMEGRAVVQIREGRYRVTVDEIVFTTNISGGIFTPGTRTKLETYALNGSGQFRRNFWNAGSSPIIDYDLFSLFELKEREDQDEDW